MIQVDTTQDILYLGRQGESNYRYVDFDLTDLMADLTTEDATVVCLIKRSGHVPIICNEFTYDLAEKTARLILTDVETQYGGECYIELHYMVGDVVAKTARYAGHVDRTLVSGFESRHISWVQEVLDAKEEIMGIDTEVQEYAEQAEASAAQAQESAESAQSDATLAGEYKTSAQTYATQASGYANDAHSAANTAVTASNNALAYRNQAQTSANDARIYAQAASASETNARISAQQAQAAMSTKQDKLTAGDGIRITNNVISATGTGFVIGVTQGEETEESEEGREVYEATCDKTVQEIITASDNGRPIIIALTLDGAPGPLQVTPVAVEVYRPTQSVIIGFGERTDEYGTHTSWTLNVSASDATLTLVTVEPASGGVTSVNGQTGDVTVAEPYMATYGTTTSAQIETAYQAGKDIYVIYNGYVYTMRYRNSATNHRFVCVYGGKEKSIACQSDTWIPNGDLTFLTTSYTAPVSSVNGMTGAVVIPTATTSANGLMSSADKALLDSVTKRIASTLPVNTVTGAVVSVEDGADNIPVKDLTIAIDYKSGGWTGANVTKTGKNLFDKSKVVGGYIDDEDGEIKGSAPYYSTDFIKVVGGESYYCKTEQTSSYWGAWYDENKAYIIGQTQYEDAVITAPSNAMYVRLTVANSQTGNVDTFALNYPSTDTAYHAYTGTTHSIDWQSTAGTVYGGTLDVTTGVLTSTLASDGTELATPQTYQLTPTEVSTLLGSNNVWADTGDTTLTYRASLQPVYDDYSSALTALNGE